METLDKTTMRSFLGLTAIVVGSFCTIFSTPLSCAAFDYTVERNSILVAEQQIRKKLKGASDGERLKLFSDLHLHYTLLEHPEFGTTIGRFEGNDRWTDTSLKAIAQRKVDMLRFRELVQNIDRNRLSVSDQLNYDLLAREFDDSVQGQKFRGEYLAISQLGGVHQSVTEMIAMMPAESVEHYEDILARLEHVPTLVENSVTLLQRGVKAGITPPRITLREVPRQVRNLLTPGPLDSPLLKPFTDFPTDIPKDEKQRLEKAALRIYRQRLSPTFNRLRVYLTEDYIPRTRQSVAMADLPNGPAWYAFQVRKSTTSNLTPLAIHNLGLKEVKRIRVEMEKIIAETGFEGSFADFNHYLRSDPRFYFDNADNLLAGYRAIAERADAGLGKLFGKLPELGFKVLPVPAFAERSKPAAYYQRGSLESKRPGYFFANTYDLKSRPKWGMEALTLHEAVPGHHLQISLQQELDNVPWFRRYGGYTAYMEGWALYAESLGYSLGFYQDPYARYGQLSYEMWRAVRLVVDTGIHSLQWNRRKAIEYFKANSGKSEHDIEVEVDRYIVWPAQALAYKIGELKIKQLAKKAQRSLGKQFDIRAFHDAVLSGGAMPLDILETRINQWVTKQANAKTRGASAGPEKIWALSNDG